MRLLILSEDIHWKQRNEEYRYCPPDDVELVTAEINSTVDVFTATLFDYDVAIIHIEKPTHHSLGYYSNLPKLAQDCAIALQNGRAIICLAEARDFNSGSSSYPGMRAYEWLANAGIELQDNYGEAIKPSGAGRAIAIQEYLEYAPKYYQIITKPESSPNNRLAVVEDTEITVGLEYQVEKGTLVILPPPLLDKKCYNKALPRLVEVARRYYERSQRHIPISDAPDWLESYLVPRAKELDGQIKELAEEKDKYDQIAYVLYGSGDDLEQSVALLLQDLGFDVERQPIGANIDQKARYAKFNLGFAIEITGIRDIVKKDTNKIAQAWKYLNDRAGTPEENDRLMIVANTQCHLDPKQRNSQSFTPDVVQLLSSNGVLLITTFQLYEQWTAVQDGITSADEFVQRLHSTSGLYG